jgi:predicted membrane-bound spermidine synthase
MDTRTDGDAIFRRGAPVCDAARNDERSNLPLLLCVIFFFSGAAGVLFETLWFRVTGLTLGSSLWASNIVLASFMAGLAAGSAIAARFGERFPRPLRLYAIIEVVVGLTGLVIVVVLPALGPALGGLFAPFLAHPLQLNLLRVAVAFSLMLVPATAMGITLPLLARTVARGDDNFGRVLGRLYGWNTLGGMAGALCGELWLIGWLGLRGTAAFAAALNLAAAVGALYLAGRVRAAVATASEPASTPARGARAWRLLAAAFMAGATLLALEVCWFRFLQFWVFGTSLIFAAMLVAVLLGIGAGGVIAARWLGRDPRAQRFAPVVSLAAGIAVELSFVLFEPRVGKLTYTTADTAAAFLLFLRLMLPTSVLSGVLFTLLGAAQRQECGGAAEAAGRLTLANTLGAMVGSLLAGFVLIPRIGLEKSFFAAMLSYGLIACLAITVPAAARSNRRPGKVAIAAGALFVLAGALFPFGLLKRHFLPLVLERYQSADLRLLEMREGMTETVMYLRKSYRGQPLNYRLMTNGHSMSATTYRGRRYMKLYVYWALALNPSTRNALLISYGVGSTAKALTDTRQLESIDVVDISRDILELGRLAFPDTQPPLRDPRVRVHVEDGRFFLQTTKQRFDLITAEPPPLRGAGVSNLYSREYFQLVRDRLREGGVATYWLPVNQLWLSETKAIMRGFCDAFPDCSLWSGAGLQWMLAGTRGARGQVPEEQFSAQWHDPVVAPELADLGFEKPESLGATFLADAGTLDQWTKDSPALDDDHPGRILAQYPSEENGDPIYWTWAAPRGVRQRFESSAFLREHWPPALRLRSTDSLGPQTLFDDLAVWGHFNPIVGLHAVLTLSSLRTLPLLFMGTEPAVQHIAVPLYEAGARDADLEFEMGARAMSQRDYAGAADHLARVTDGPRTVQAGLLRALALGLQRKVDEARSCLDALNSTSLSPVDAYSANWLARFLHGAAGAGPRSAASAPQ